MLIRLAPAAALLVSAATWVAAGVAVGLTWANASDARVMRPRRVTRLRPAETREAYRRRTRVHRWKRWVPDAGAWWGGRRKRLADAGGTGGDGRARLGVEVLRAELVHWTMLAISPVWLAWSRGWVLVANAAFAILLNVPCLVVTRSTRARLAAIA